MEITEIGDFPALGQIGRSLWKQGKSRGAAILVGAGFSRNAQLLHAGTRLPPLWQDLAQEMEARVGTPGTGLRHPLRTAEEFRAVLGDAALEALIRELIADEQWLPGELHKQLVALPWVDILTTNWDTLLERAATTALEQNYEIVRCLEDIAKTRSPRVVKLHGSLPSNRPFIITEEDYRTYPRKFAPFVNLAQQVLLENELCLLGFSGDDPNFLEWSGWIRDNLGQSARRIYLVGALNLSPAQRRLLEIRNVSPIDLSPLVQDVERMERDRRASELFLGYLQGAQPKPAWEWESRQSLPPAICQTNSSDEQLAASFVGILKNWETVRRKYPGWAVCPPDLQRGLKQDTPYALANQKALAQMTERDRARIVFEGGWRLDTAFLPVGPWAATLEPVVGNVSLWEDQGQRDFLLIQLLRAAREDRNEAAFDKWAKEIEVRTAGNGDIASWLAYEKCLWARDSLRFADLSKLVDAIKGDDPLWSLRRSALYCYLGDFRSARLCAEEAALSARDTYTKDRDSIWALSRFAWAHFCIGALRDWMKEIDPDRDRTSLASKIHETKCEPWNVLSDIDQEVDNKIRELADTIRDIEPQFEAGTYKDHRNTIRFGASPDIVIYSIERLADTIGIPSRTQSVIVLSPRMGRAEALAYYETDAQYLRLLRIVQSDQPEVLERRFGRLQVANLSIDQIAFLKNILADALRYGLVQLAKRESWVDQFWSRRVGVYVEILSRLLVRADEQEATEWLNKALAFGNDRQWQTPELCEPLEHLLKRSLSAISLSHRSELLVRLMSFPMPEETVLADHVYRDWPDLSDTLQEPPLTRNTSDESLTQRIVALVGWVRNGKPETRARAVKWLMHLQLRDFLKNNEEQQFAEALWSRRPSSRDFPSDTTLRSHMFIVLRSSYQSEALNLFKERSHEDSSADYLIAVAGITRFRPDGTRLELFDRTKALAKLEHMIKWQPQAVPLHDLGQVGRQNELARRFLGAAIADAVLAVLGPGDLSPDIIEEVFFRESDILPIVQSYPQLVRLATARKERALKGILRAMVSRDKTDVWAGFNALHRWIHELRGEPAVPRPLIEAAISTVESRREPGLLHALNLCHSLTDHGLLDPTDPERLSNALGLIYIETAYAAALNEKYISPTTLTLVRAAAVRLAKILEIRGTTNLDIETWLKSAPVDPMPEVRFALDHRP